MDTIIEKEIYKELSRIMTQDMGCECEVYKVWRESDSPSFQLGTPVTDRVVPWMEFSMGGVDRKESGSYPAYMYSKARELYKEYKKGDFMKVMFVVKKNRAVFDTWYNYMDVVKKHRKIIIACESPLDFCHKFNPDEMGVTYTTFYFDKDLGPADIYECVAEFKHHYTNEEFKYIVENKLRTISIADIVETNDMSKFEELKLETNTLIDLGVKEKSTTISAKEYEQIGIELLSMTRRIDDLSVNIRTLEKRLNEYDRRFGKWSSGSIQIK